MSKAVLVIDVQEALFNGPEEGDRPFAADEVISHINVVTQWARHQSTPVIFIQHEKPNSILAYQSSGWQLAEGLERLDNDVYIRKLTPDSFLDTELKAYLDEHGITELIVCGFASEFCVDATVRRAAALGYQVRLITDAHTTHDKAHATGEQIRLHHSAILPMINSFKGEITAFDHLALLEQYKGG